MTRYIVPPSSNQKMFRIYAYGSIGLMLIVLALSQSTWAGLDDRVSHAIGWVAIGLFWVVIVGALVLIYRESIDKVWRKVSFDLTDGKIIRVMDGRPPLELPITEINFLSESRLGLIVRTGEPVKSLFIPRKVEGFDQLERQLVESCKASAIEHKTAVTPILPLALMVIFCAALFTAKAGLVIVTVGVLALLFQAWSILSMRRILARTRSPKILMAVFVFAWLILLWLVYQRASASFSS